MNESESLENMIENEVGNIFGFLCLLINNTLETVYLYTAVSFLTKLIKNLVLSSQMKVTKHLT